ncbi:MAG: 2-C-methyl-D-erythritol 2,4-cyclodiphosphate synthase [Candidatus Edwardsbacteria bacterium]|jgi:2-C-methyl-D-erythritol 2,4-cyclodiphosphate synthase|nr:2-C-methyl-D-erythritol 2,4-cyclodiphosphate synthase [Candidatus Edwardsbacteria bacterium]
MAAQAPLTRVGFGYDIHRLVKGRALVLGGVRIPHATGLLGHSDADVLCHAIADSLLGAAALGDIGRHFPDDDPRWRGVSSLLLLGKVAALLRRSRFAIANVDGTVVAEAPRIMPHAAAMRANIARALGVPPARVSVKATTNEGLGAVGRRLGICAHAVAAVAERPRPRRSGGR